MIFGIQCRYTGKYTDPNQSLLQTVQLCDTLLLFKISTESILPILWIGIINTGLGCFLYFSSISSLPAQTVAVCGYLEPLSAVLFSALILHETMLPLQILGATLILGGSLMFHTKRE